MIDAVVDLDIGDFERIDVLKATDIEAIFRRIGSSLMMRVDSTN